MAGNRIIYQVDAFTNRPFRGNPAGVCLLEEPATEGWMQNIAAEMNVSETAFTVPNGDGFDIRYFTPMTEVPLCGHATLASAHILWEQGVVAGHQAIAFNATAGVVPTLLQSHVMMNLITPLTPLDQPATRRHRPRPPSGSP